MTTPPVWAQQVVLAVIGFLTVWGASGFALDYRAILAAVLGALVGYAKPWTPGAADRTGDTLAGDP